MRYIRNFTISMASCWVCWFVLSTQIVAQSHHDWSYNLGLYEVNIRNYSEEGTFKAFQDDLDRIDSLGAGILWLMPIHPIGEENRLGSLGSPYSVQDYYAVNPDYGNLDGFKSLVHEIHERGMYVIIDWVANHTSWDHVLTQSNPEWYVKDLAGNFIPPPGTNWSDVIELNYDRQGLRTYMIEAMKFWVDSVGVDGFRFDAVDFVPDDFWTVATQELKEAKPDIFLLAEGPGEELIDLGFHMNYSWAFYGFGGGILSQITQGVADANSFRTFVNAEQRNYSDGAYRLYFISNHDENAWEGSPAQLFGPRAVNFAVLSHMINGMPLVYNGEEAGMTQQLAFFDKDVIPWRDHPLFDYYQRLFALKRRNAALWNGFDENEAVRIKTTQNAPIYMFERSKDGDRVIGVFNLSAQSVDFQPSDTFSEGTYRNVLTDELLALSQDTEFSFGPWQFLALEQVSSNANIHPSGDLVPSSFKVTPAYPNPFNPNTTVSVHLNTINELKVEVYDTMGRLQLARSLGVRNPGVHSVVIQASDWSSGTYLLRVYAGNEVHQQRISLIK